MLSMPATCWLCRMPVTVAIHGICSLCLKNLPSPPLCCRRCGLPAVRTLCGSCLRHPPPWIQMVYISDWQPPLQNWVRQLKFSGVTALSAMLARLILLSWLTSRREHNLPRPDLLLCVPLHKNRLWQRGYNQMDEVSRYLAHWVNCHYAAAGVIRQRHTKIQHHLSASERKQNLRGAFRMNITVQGKHIALADDVITTGSTLEEISRLLLAAGAASVQVWSLCRTL